MKTNNTYSRQIFNLGFILGLALLTSISAWGQSVGLQITKSASSDTARAGDTLTYTIVVRNIGSGPITKYDVIDIVPTALSYVLGSASGMAVFNATNNNIKWSMGSLSPQASISLTLRAVISPQTANYTVIRNSALIPGGSGLTSTATTVIIPPPPHLSIEKSVDLLNAVPGDTLTYRVTITNSGSGDASAVEIVDTLPQHVRLLPGSITLDGQYLNSGNRVVWSLSKVIAGSTTELSFKAVIDIEILNETTVKNYAFLTSTDTLYSDTTSTLVRPFPPALVISKEVNARQAYRGDTLTYTLTVNNLGRGRANSVVISDVIPAFTQYAGSSASDGGTFDAESNKVTWNIPVILPLHSMAMSFRAVVSSNAPYEGTVRNFALITHPDTSSSDTTTTIIKRRTPTMSISKSTNLYEAYTGDTLEYTLSIVNFGTTIINPVVVTDAVPAFTSFIANSATANGQFDPESRLISWMIPSMNPSQTLTLGFKVSIDSAALSHDSVWNVAHIITPDSLSSEIVTTYILSKRPDLAITKTVNSASALNGDTLTYTLTIINSGRAAARNVDVEDTVPASLTYLAGSASDAGQYDNESHILRWSLSSVEALSRITLTFKAATSVDIADSTIVKNHAAIVSPGTRLSNVVETVIRRYLASLSITKAVDSVEASPQSPLTYTLHITNTGNRGVTGITVLDAVPALSSYILGSVSAGGHFDSVLDQVFWQSLSLNPGQSQDLTFKVAILRNAKDGDVIANQALITQPSNSASDTVNTIVRIRSGVDDLVVYKAVDKSSAASGDQLHYTINVSNTGPDAAIGVVLTDTLPAHTRYIDGSGGNGIYDAAHNTVYWNLGTISGHSGTDVAFDVTVDWETPAQTVIQNRADITAPAFIKGNTVSTTILGQPQLRVTKTAGVASGSTGSLIPYTVTVTNISDAPADGVTLVDSLPVGFFYVTGSTVIGGKSSDDPSGGNPYQWQLGHLGPDSSLTVRYTVVVGTAARSGIQENFAWAESGTGATKHRSPIASARVSILSTTLNGAIRGRVIVDCDNDGIPDADSVPSGMNIFLDDGSQSRVNTRGMFYFSTVRAGEHTVTLDTRGLVGYVFASKNTASIFSYVHEAGEAYITFRLCPERPVVTVNKWVTLVPKVKVTKTATLDEKTRGDSAGVTINYEVTVQSNGGVDPTTVRVVDSFPEETRLVIQENQTVTPSLTNHTLVYQLAVDKKPLTQSVYYSLKDLAPGIRRFLVNKIHLEGTPTVVSEKSTPIISAPTEVSVGPFRRTPPKDIQFDLIGAYFETSKANLRPDAFPILQELADTLKEYDGADLKAEGHADYRRIHTKEFPSNWELSTARAKSVVDWLAQNANIDRSRMAYEGFAATRPRDTGRTPEALQKNRRVELFVKARKDARVDLSALTTDRWSASTTLELAPIIWDTLVSSANGPIVIGLNDVWEIRVLIESKGPGAADKVILSDPMPQGAEYIDGSALLDGKQVTVSPAPSGAMEIRLGRLIKGQTTELRYQIRAAGQTSPSGHSKSILEMQTPAGEKVSIYSNPVQFK